MSPRTLSSILDRGAKATYGTLRRLLNWISAREVSEDEQRGAVAVALAWARAQVDRMGLRRFAAEMGVDAANLSKVLSGRRKSGQRLMAMLQKARHYSAFVRLIERRLVGQDWVRGIQPTIPDAPPTVVFASHKGGVAVQQHWQSHPRLSLHAASPFWR